MENPRLRDVLRHGQASRHAATFSIDWDAGPLLLPMLDAPFAVKVEAGEVSVGDGAEGPDLLVAGLAVPLDPATMDLVGDLLALHEAQAWRLAHWEMGRDSLTYRRFFNISGLIGVRQSDAAVFADTHALTLDLVRRGLAQGLRVDHVDGLVDPAGYLARLADAAGVPIWVEKILTGDEAMPDWPVEGTTGYETAVDIARLLIHAEGLTRLDAGWREATGRTGDFAAFLRDAKHQVLRQELAAELHQLMARAAAISGDDPTFEAGAEALREAVIALLVEIPRYRTYFTDDTASDGDRALLAAATDRAAEGLRTDRVVRRLAQAISDAALPSERVFRDRFQQVTGALTAKAHEDTAEFRYNRCLALNEVGSDPDAPPLTAAAFAAIFTARQAAWPQALNLISSHDCKRGEDARMRLVALTHLPGTFGDLFAMARALPGATDIDQNTLWYLVQSAVAIWQPGREDVPDRLAQHMEKALREAKEGTNWEHPDPAVEDPVLDLARRLGLAWLTAPPPSLAPVVARAEALSMMQVALWALLPGVPDLYAGTEGGFFALTDPDNRPDVDFAALPALPDAAGFAGAKAGLVRRLLALRHRAPRFFARAALSLSEDNGALVLTRTARGVTVRATLRPDAPAEDAVS